jgi:hypothetical protein
VFEESWGGAAKANKTAVKPAKWTLDRAVTPQELMAQSDKLTVAMQLLQDLHSEGHRCVTHVKQAQCSELQAETAVVQSGCVWLLVLVDVHSSACVLTVACLLCTKYAAVDMCHKCAIIIVLIYALLPLTATTLYAMHAVQTGRLCSVSQ